MHRYGAGVAEVLIVPDLVQQLLARVDAPVGFGEEMQQVELVGTRQYVSNFIFRPKA